MQNSQKFQKPQDNKNNEKDSKRDFFSVLTKKLRERDEWEVRDRIAKAVGFITAATITYLLGGLELFFGTYPLCIALACSERRMLAPIALGSLALIVSGKLPALYVFASVSVILIRTLAALLPFVMDEVGGKGKSVAGEKSNLPAKIRPDMPSTYKKSFFEKRREASAGADDHRESNADTITFVSITA